MFSNPLKLSNLLSNHGNFVRQLRKYRLRRALLYVPGDDDRKITKARNLTVDSLILDCEDGVAANRKQAARDSIASVLNTAAKRDEEHSTADIGVRLNSADSGHLDADLSAICRGNLPQTLHLPKVNTKSDLDHFHAALKATTTTTGRGGALTPPDLFIYSESCESLLALPELCRHAVDLSRRDQLYRLAGITFGSDDLCADLGATRTPSGAEISYARQFVVVVAKAFKLQAIDMVDIDLNDMAGLCDRCSHGSRMGYTGKQVIHPKQIEIVQDAFKPSAILVDWAMGVLDAFAQHQKAGRGAFTFRGQMIDAPTMKQARNIVESVANSMGR